MSFHYYWMPDEYPVEFSNLDQLLESCFNVLCRETKTSHRKRPKFVIKRSNIGPGGYNWLEKKIILDLSTYKNKSETPITILCHEFGHFIQFSSGRMDIESLKRGNFCFDNIVYSRDIIYNIISQEDYEKLPWEKDANDFARKLEPVVKKRLKLIY